MSLKAFYSEDNKTLEDDLKLHGDHIPSMSPLERDKGEFVDIQPIAPLDVKVGTGIKILTANKLLTRLSILLAQVIAGNNSYKQRNGIREILYLLYQHNTTTKRLCNNLIKSL